MLDLARQVVGVIAIIVILMTAYQLLFVYSGTPFERLDMFAQEIKSLFESLSDN